MTIITTKHDNHQQQQKEQDNNNNVIAVDNYYNNSSNKNSSSREQLIFERKIEAVTSDLIPHFKSLMYSISKQNALIICDYLIGQNTEINPTPSYRRNQIQALAYFSKYMKNVPFKEITRDDIINYLDSLRKPEEKDPLHKWIGTYNQRQVNLLRFFKWLYFPELPPKHRPTPNVYKNINRLHRKEKSIYKASDLWTEEDDALFLKYCPDKRDRAYHMLSRDSSCRPGELLNLKIGDLNFKQSSDGTKQYAEIVVNGKTGTRHIPLFYSVPYIKDWIDDHPSKSVLKSPLIPSRDLRHRRFGKRMRTPSLHNIYIKYKKTFFPKILEDPAVPPEDKIKIRALLRKPWNPYIRRHSALTQKAKILKEPILKAHSGWSQNSQMHLKYEHWFGNESSEALLEAYGVLTPEDSNPYIDTFKPKACPNCSESNIPDSKFCKKCRMVLTYDAYQETLEQQQKKDKRLEELEKSFQAQLETQRKQQELLESLWLHQQKQEQQQQEHKNQQYLPKKEDSTANTPVRVEKITVSRRNEPAVPPTPVAETFLLVDDKHNNGDNRYDWFKNWSIEKSPRGSWSHLPTTKEQEEKWHRAMVEGLKQEQNNKNNNDNLE
jgi:integrase/recombinase XerD